MPHIAIITGREIQYGYDDTGAIINSITEWTEVTDEELRVLRLASNKKNFTVLVRVDTPEFIRKTVADYIADAKAEKQKQEEAKAKKEAALLARRYKAQLKDQEAKRKLYQELQQEFGKETK